MKASILGRLGDDELAQYAARVGVDPAGRDRDGLVAEIVRRRARVATVSVLGGLKLDIPVRRMHDKRVTDAINGARTDEEVEAAFEALVGKDNAKALLDWCTDDDGTVDLEAYVMGVRQVFGSDELKNF